MSDHDDEARDIYDRADMPEQEPMHGVYDPVRGGVVIRPAFEDPRDDDDLRIMCVTKDGNAFYSVDMPPMAERVFSFYGYDGDALNGVSMTAYLQAQFDLVFKMSLQHPVLPMVMVAQLARQVTESLVVMRYAAVEFHITPAEFLDCTIQVVR